MMTLDEAIIHCEDVAEEKDKLCKRYDDASGYTRSHNEDIRTTNAKRCEECAEEHRQLAEWLKELKAYRQMRQMTEPEKVTCITCRNLRTELIQRRNIPDSICAAPIWKELNRTVPHVIGHDPREPIRCDHWKPKGVTEG